MQIALVVLGAIVVCLTLAFAVLLVVLGPTKGKRIAEYKDPQKALLVIDIQEDFTGATAKPPFPYKDSEKLIESANRLIAMASAKRMPIIYIRQEFDGFVGTMISKIFSKGTAMKGNAGTEIDRRISIVSDHIFPKPKGDAFSNPGFERFLTDCRINELYLSGLDAEFCVFHTARGALNRGYKVNILTDCIALRRIQKWDDLMMKYKRNCIALTTTDVFSARP